MAQSDCIGDYFSICPLYFMKMDEWRSSFFGTQNCLIFYFPFIYMYIVHPYTQNNNYHQNADQSLLGNFPHKLIQAFVRRRKYVKVRASIKTLMNVMCDSFKSIDF